jgi:hypothetical protein
MKLITRTAYAKKKGVSPQYIYKLIERNKLITFEPDGGGRYYSKLVVDCPENDKLFSRKKKES